MLDRGSGCRVRANLLGHGGVSGHEAGEYALDDAAEVGGYLATQDHQQPLQATEGHDWGPASSLFLCVSKYSILNASSSLKFESSGYKRSHALCAYFDVCHTPG